MGAESFEDNAPQPWLSFDKQEDPAGVETAGLPPAYKPQGKAWVVPEGRHEYNWPNNKEVVMNKFVLRWLINIAGLYLAVLIVPGVQLRNEDFLAFVWLALILGLLNALVRPILKFLTCPLIILTLGLGTLVLNTVMLYILQWAAGLLNISFVLTNFWQAFLGALVVSIVSMILTMALRDEMRSGRPRRRS